MEVTILMKKFLSLFLCLTCILTLAATGTITIFAYEDRGKYYLEQPYQGIYKTDRKLFERLNETD